MLMKTMLSMPRTISSTVNVSSAAQDSAEKRKSMIHVSFEDVTDFPTTRISLVRAAAGGSDRRSREALATLCGMYWYPLYAYVRRCGHDADESQDLTQGFIVRDRKSTRLNSSHMSSSYAVFCLKKKKD